MCDVTDKQIDEIFEEIKVTCKKNKDLYPFHLNILIREMQHWMATMESLRIIRERKQRENQS